jgi:hypothetical protein
VISNPGPAAVADAVVSDLLPPGLGGASWTCVATGTASRTASGFGDLADAVYLPLGETLTYSLSANIDDTGATRRIVFVAFPLGARWRQCDEWHHGRRSETGERASVVAPVGPRR